MKYKNYPIHHIQNRIKHKNSIEKKLLKKNIRVSAEEARENLTDIAGIERNGERIVGNDAGR